MNRATDPVAKSGLNPAIDPAVREAWTTPPYATNGFRKLDLNPDANNRVVFHSEPGSVAVEQYRLLRRNLAESFPQGATLLVTSPTKGDGKTMNAINLAWCLAETHAPTLLAEADLRQPSVAKVLGYRPEHGIETAMMGEIDPESTVAVCTNGVPFHVAAVSKAQRDPIWVLKNTSTKAYLEWARSKFRWVILDTPPVIPAADVPELAPLTDAVLLVVRVRSTPVDLVQKSFKMLGDRVRGVILNEATLCWDSYYRYLSGYHAAK
jgi:Mrp family chromosome partitioning ATPase